MKTKALPRRALSPMVVLEAARRILPEEFKENIFEARPYAGQKHMAELLSFWGNDLTPINKALVARRILIELKNDGYTCLCDVLNTNGFDAIFETIREDA